MAASIWTPGTQATPTLPSVAPVQFVDGTATAPSITFVGDTNTGIWSPADGSIGITSDGVNQATFSGTGVEIPSGSIKLAAENTIASAATCDIGAVLSNSMTVTGTASIGSFGTTYSGPKFLRFTGILTLNHSVNLVLPGGVAITTGVGDCCIVMPKATAGVSDGWVVVSYQYASSVSARNLLDVYSRAETQTTADTSAAVAAGRIKSIDYTLAGNALTLKLNPSTLSFRSTTLTSGAPVSVSNAAQITTTISSGSTGGTVSAVQSDIVLLAINNAGTMELAWTNLAGGLNLDETNLITTVAEGGAGAADSATVIYSTTARTGVAYKVVGIFRSTQTTAGTWAQAPTLVQGVGGQALAALSSLGYGQIYASPSRVLGTTYYNTSGKPRMVTVSAITSAATFFSTSVIIGGVPLPTDVTHSNSSGFVKVTNFIVPPGMSYVVTMSSATLQSWVELG